MRASSNGKQCASIHTDPACLSPFTFQSRRDAGILGRYFPSPSLEGEPRTSLKNFPCISVPTIEGRRMRERGFLIAKLYDLV